MRAIAAVLMSVVLSARAQPPSIGPTPTGSSTAVPRTAAPSIASPTSASPSDVGQSLRGLLPALVNGAATTTSSLSPSSRGSPRVFLKVIARLGTKPPDGQVALAFNSDATIYAVQVDGIGGSDILQAFLVERLGAAAAADAPTVDIGGKPVIRFGASGGTLVYASGETFFYVECQDEATAADVLKHVP
jgi:hypothetical protein